MTKRRAALALLALIAAIGAGTVAALRTRWAGDRICAAAAARIGEAAGLPVAFGACRIDPLALELRVEGLTVGAPARPLFRAEAIRARLAPIQGLGGRVQLEALEIDRPRLALDLSGAPGGAARCPPPLLDRIEPGRIRIRGGGAEVALAGGGRVRVEGFALDAGPDARGRWRLRRGARRLAVSASAATIEAAVAGRTWRLAGAAADGAVALDLSSAELARASASAGGVALGLRGEVEELCAPRLELAATAAGELPALLALAGVDAGDWRAAVKLEVRATGTPAAPRLAGTVRFAGLRGGPVAPGDGRIEWRWLGDRIALDRIAVPLGPGEIGARGSLALRRGAPVDLEVALDRVELGELLERVGVPGAWVALRLDGTARLAGPLWPPALAATLDARLARFRALTGPWRAARPADQAILEFDGGRIHAPFRIDPQGITFEKARIEVGAGRVDADAAIHFDEAAGFEVRARGDVDLGALRHVAGLPWSGRAAVTARIGAAPYGNPRADGTVRYDGLRFLDVELGSGTAVAGYGPDTTLRLSQIDGRRGELRYRGWAAVDLGADPVRLTASSVSASGPVRDLLDAVAGWLPRARDVRRVLDGRIEEATATASGPAAAPDVEFRARLGAGAFLGRAFDGGRLEGRVARAAAVTFDRAALTAGAGSATARGRIGLAEPFPWDLSLALAGVPAGLLGLPGGDWTGSLSGTGSLRGSWARPELRLALNGDAIALRGAPIGTVQLAGTMAADRVLVTGSADGMRLSGEARLDGARPWRARAELDLEDAARLWPGGAPAGLRAAVTGVLTAGGTLDDPGAVRAELRLDRLSAAYADLKLESAEPVRIAWDGARLAIEGFAIRGVNTRFSLDGAIAADRTLDLHAAGSLDLRLLSGVLPALRAPHGELALEAQVTGSLDEPTLLGGGRIADAGFQLRGGTAALEELAGDLAFSQNRVLFDGVAGRLNGGAVALSGELQLVRLVPARLRVEARLEEVPVAVLPTLPVVLSGTVTAVGTPDETAVTGTLHVVRARYTQNVDLERSLLALRRERLAAVHAYDKAGEWLHFDLRLAVDGDARVDNDLVRGGVRGDLTLTGTLAAPGVLGSLAMTDGSRAVFRGNEFRLTHAVVEFTDRQRLEMSLDVHGEAEVRDYQIFMHLFGPIADPQLTLTSTPPLSQPDIVTLLSLGFTRHDTPGGASMQGAATAAAAQALMSASGLDEQVRRFLPRGVLVRDLSVHIVSAYSEATGQVEPRAEFESRLLDDRVRIRYQAPISGARGQMAQAELGLGRHTSIQYQWDTDNPYVPAGDHGLDLKLRWEWTE